MSEDVGEPTLVLRGSISGTDLAHPTYALEHAARHRSSTVFIDLSGLVSWSIVAQAMLMSTARKLARRGGRLVLLDPTPALRLQGGRIGIFRRVMALDTRGGSAGKYGASDVGVALVSLRSRTTLLLRSSVDRVLRLPGGHRNDGEDDQVALARHLTSQLGLTYEPDSLQPFSPVEPFVVNEGGHRIRTSCFEAPTQPTSAPSNGLERVWASAQTAGLFSPSAHYALTALRAADEID